MQKNILSFSQKCIDSTLILVYSLTIPNNNSQPRKEPEKMKKRILIVWHDNKSGDYGYTEEPSENAAQDAQIISEYQNKGFIVYKVDEAILDA